MTECMRPVDSTVFLPTLKSSQKSMRSCVEAVRGGQSGSHFLPIGTVLMMAEFNGAQAGMGDEERAELEAMRAREAEWEAHLEAQEQRLREEQEQQWAALQQREAECDSMRAQWQDMKGQARATALILARFLHLDVNSEGLPYGDARPAAFGAQGTIRPVQVVHAGRKVCMLTRPMRAACKSK